jgi:hypothetical protein
MDEDEERGRNIFNYIYFWFKVVGGKKKESSFNFYLVHQIILNFISKFQSFYYYKEILL